MEEEGLDYFELAKTLWKSRKQMAIACGIAFVIGLIIVMTTPKSYTTTVTIAPEVKYSVSASTYSSLGSFLTEGKDPSLSGDALHAKLYPKIIKSTPFIVELFDVRVINKENNIDTTLYDYMLHKQKGSLLGKIIGVPFRIIGWITSLSKEKTPKNKTNKDTIKHNEFQLTEKENLVLQTLQNNINVEVDKKTYVTTLEVSMQDAVISAQLTDSILNHLQKYIRNYRTAKARENLSYAEKVFEEAKEEYYIAQKLYADYIDSNKNIILNSYGTERMRLLADKNLKFDAYSTSAKQLQQAKTKVAEITPVFAVIEPPTVAIKASSPKKLKVPLFLTFLVFVVEASWILFMRDFIKEMINQR